MGFPGTGQLGDASDLNAEEASEGIEAAARKERMKERTARVDWAELLKRRFDFDVFASVRCGGRRRVLA